jgi:hypothetical protein
MAWSHILEASIIATRLRNAERLDLACITALAALRGVWASAHGREPVPQDVTEQADLAQQMFFAYGRELWDACSDGLLEPRGLLAEDPDGTMVGYPVKCLRLTEVLGLFALLVNENERATVADWIEAFLQGQPGAAHPISDRWAVSLIPSLIAIGHGSAEARRTHLRSVIRWLGDRHDQENFGLAPADATPEDEVKYLLGSSLEHIELRPRRSSYLAAVVLDLCTAFDLAEEYDVAYNDISAVRVTPQLTLPNDDVGQYVAGGLGFNVPVDTSLRYAESWAAGSPPIMAQHQSTETSRQYLGRLGRFWDQLAISALLRDRHWFAGIKALADQT